MSAPRFARLWRESAVSSNGCRMWAGTIDRDGYGRIGDGRTASILAHRRAYAAFVAPIPDGMTVDHICFKPACVEPSHLRLLTAEANRAQQRSGSKTHCVNGHEYTPENTYNRPGRGQGKRDCRTCIRARVRKYNARKAAA